MFNLIEAPKILAKEVAEADHLINQKFRSHAYIGEKRIAQWRNIGMLDETTPGSWEETTLAHLLENQRCIQECAWADKRTVEECA